VVRDFQGRLSSVLLCVFALSLAMAFGFGFTVDDALISTRVAHHLHSGVGYRFNPDAEVVDCVTPLGWAYLLAPFAAEPWVGLWFARYFGMLCALASALVLGLHCKALPATRLALVLLPVGLCLPLGAWSVSGMETPLVTLLLSLTLLSSRWAIGFATLAAALRPELVPYAFVLAALRPAEGGRDRLLNVALALLGPLCVALVRAAVFGNPAPLAVLAKPSDLASGLFYLASGVLWLGLPILLLTLKPWMSLAPKTKVIAIACLAHVLALAVAGGDWMALFRLFVPILPPLVFVAAELARASSLWALLLRSLAASAVAATLLVSKGAATRGVWDSRQQLSREAAPLLAASFRVASLDVGWVGATTRAPVLDLAGVTDPEVALLPGGHTSKQLPRDFLLRREPDTLVLLVAPGVSAEQIAGTPWRELPFARTVEQRLTRLDGAEDFVPIGSLSLRGTTQRYLILRRLSERLAQR
jgi:hypothetical protein